MTTLNTSTFYPTTASGWTNPNNAKTLNGSVAEVSGALPMGTYSAGILLGGFGITGPSGSDTINSITVTMYPTKISGTDNFVLYWYLARSGSTVGDFDFFNAAYGGTPYSQAETLTVPANAGAWSVADIANLQIISYIWSYSEATPVAVVGIDTVSVSVNYTTATPVTAFTFTDVTNVEPSSVNDSNAITMTGPASCAMSGSATDPSSCYYKINSGAWTVSTATPPTIYSGDQIQLRVTASASVSTARSMTLALGGVSDTYSVTTRAADRTPVSWTWSAVTGAALGSVQTSATKTITGMDAGTALSIAGSGTYSYSKNGGSYVTSSGTIDPGDTLTVKVTASATPGASTYGDVTVGTLTNRFTVTSLLDTTPDAFSFTPEVSATTSTLYTSNTITVTGINSAATTTFATSNGSSWEYKKNAGAWTAVGSTSLALNDTLQLRMISPAASAVVGSITATIGGVQGAYLVTTGADVIPDAISFTAVTNASGGVVYTSNAVVLSGMTAAVPVTATIIAGAEAKVNSGSWTPTSVTVMNGDSISLRNTASNVPHASVVSTITIGTTVGTYTIASANPPPMMDY